MTFLTLDFSFDNSVLAPLADLKAPVGKDSLDITISQLPKSMSEPLKVVFKSLTGKDLEESSVIFRLVFKEGKTPKIYSPAIYSQEGGLVLRWGNEIIKLSVSKNSIKPVDVLFEGLEYSGTIDQVKIGKYPENVFNLIISEFEGYDEIVMPLVIKNSNWETEFDLTQAKAYLKKGNSEGLVGMVAEMKTGGSPFSNNLLVSNDDLPQGVDLVITKSRKVETKFGTNYVLTVQANPDLGINEDLDFFGFSQIRKKLDNGALIDQENPAILNFVKGTNDKGEIRYQMTFDVKWKQDETTLNLSDVLANWN